VDAVELSGLVVVDRSSDRDTIRLDQPLYGEVIRATMPVTRARAVWRELAEAISATPLLRLDDRLRCASWQVQSGVILRPDVLLPAAQLAFARYDLTLAEQLARQAIVTSPSWAADHLLAEILAAGGRHPEAAEVLTDGPPTGPDVSGRWAAARATILYWGFDRTGEAVRVLDTAAGDRGVVDATRCWIHLFAGRCDEAYTVGQQVLDEPGVDPAIVVQAAVGVTAAAALLGRPDQAMQARSRAIIAAGQAEREGLPWVTEQIGYTTCLALLTAGRLREAWAVADDGYQQAIAGRAGLAAAGSLAFRGVVEKLQGRVRTAIASLREAIALLRDADPFRIRGLCLHKLAAAAALGGDVTSAGEWLAEAEHERRDANQLFAVWGNLDRVWVGAAAGLLTDALRGATDVAEAARAANQPVFEAVALYDVARLGGAQAAYPRLAELADTVDSGLITTFAEATAAMVASDGAALERAGTAFDDRGMVLIAAEAWAEAARAHRRAGLRSRAVAAVTRAVRLAADCEGATTPMLDAHDSADALTRREREVAYLAAALEPSRAIAERLGLSLRTVDNHLARAYSKLGVNSRTELAALLGAHP
jgi:DNA-binding CsgD family transcriptional regulator